MNLTLAAPERGFSTTRMPTTGVSVVAKRLREIVEAAANHKRQSFLGQQYSSVLESLFEAYDERREKNWDGEGAIAVSENAYFEAVKLVELLPSPTPTPEVVVEANGSIGLEWQKDSYHAFVVTVDGSGMLSYAGIFGVGVEANGCEDLTDSLPKEIIQNIGRLRLNEE